MIKKLFSENNIPITEQQAKQFQTYYEMIVEWNQKINLTSITEYEEVIWKHFIDSALMILSNQIDLTEQKTVLDMGTGAGFPGIVLAILCPNYQFTLVDSLQKRIEFLKLVTEELHLNNVSLYHGRAEDYGNDESFRNRYDYVVSRAVAELPVLLEYCIPFVKQGGYFISYKGKKYREEIESSTHAFSELSCKLQHVDEYTLKYDKIQRYLLFIQCLEKTNSKYPRKPNKIKNNPL